MPDEVNLDLGFGFEDDMSGGPADSGKADNGQMTSAPSPDSTHNDHMDAEPFLTALPKYANIFFLNQDDYYGPSINWGEPVAPDSNITSLWWVGTGIGVIPILIGQFILGSRNESATDSVIIMSIIGAVIIILCQFQLWRFVRISNKGKTIPGQLVGFAKARVNLARGEIFLFSADYKFVNVAGEVICGTTAYQASRDRFESQDDEVKPGTAVAVLYTDPKHYRML